LPAVQSFTVPQKGWSKTKNGALLRLAEAAGFDAFLTADQSLQYQQNLSSSKIRIIVFAAPSNRMEHIGPLMPAAIAALEEMKPGEIRVISGG
jgi:alkanesulfonate monooxygenase SsuD/methylene tetrahydromethanopterin reductase-like flavin-dependent oxidoreductase (luciferase family)